MKTRLSFALSSLFMLVACSLVGFGEDPDPNEHVLRSLKQYASWYRTILRKVESVEIYWLPFTIEDAFPSATFTAVQLDTILDDDQKEILGYLVRDATDAQAPVLRPLDPTGDEFVQYLLLRYREPQAVLFGPDLTDWSSLLFRPEPVYFRNGPKPRCGKDLTCYVAVEQSMLSSDSSVAAAVNHPWFRSQQTGGSVSLPQDMRTAIQLEFDRLWAVANSTRAFAICPEWSGLVYVNGPMAPLVAQADPQRCEIQLSPALIQAVFFRATEWLSIYWQGILQVAQLPAYVEWVDPRDVIGNSTVGRRTYLDVYPEFGKITRETRVDRDLAAFWVRSVQERFLGDLRFIIAHEIGHAALWAFGPNTLANELAADCYGIWSMRTVFGTTDTRVFESFLQASVVEDRRDLWGIVATEDDLRRRKARLQFLASAPLVSEHVEFCAS